MRHLLSLDDRCNGEDLLSGKLGVVRITGDSQISLGTG